MTPSDIIFREISNKSDWQALFAKAIDKHMTQTWAFGEAKRVTGWRPRRLSIENSEEVLAICQVLHKTIAGVSIAARINLGPLILEGHADKAVDVLRAVRNRWRYLIHGVLLIAPGLIYDDETNHRLAASGFRLRSKFRWTSSRLDLTRSEEDLRNSLNSKWRNQLRKSEQSDLRFVRGDSPADANWMIARHAEHLTEKAFDGPPPRFLQALYRESPEDFNVYRAAHNGYDVGGIVAYRFGDTAYYYVGWNGSDGRKLNAGNFLLWNAALDLKHQGCTQFDLGGHGLTASSGFTGFKLGMNGACYQLSGEFFCL